MATPAPYQPRPDHPATAFVQAPVRGAEEPLSGPVQLYGERLAPHEPVVYIPDAYGHMVPVSRSQAEALRAAVPATVPRDLTPQPLIDSRAQRMLAAGVGTGVAAAGVGYGLGQILAPLLAVASSSVLWVLALVAVLASGGQNTYVTHNHNHAKWWGKATSNTKNG